jgi:uracil-DNA glycosylase
MTESSNHQVEIAEGIPAFTSITEMKTYLSSSGCHRCSLGFQPEINGVCVSRGSETSHRMIIGEAPGKEEDADREPFTGPAGRLMNDIWASVEMSTNDWYLTNVVLCRPYMPRGSGKENYTPKPSQREKCRHYLNKQIELIQPKIIVTVGAVATEAVCGVKGIKMGDWHGKLLQNMPGAQGSLVFPMYHPACILHSTGNKELYDNYRRETWNDIRKLKDILTKENI